jgi:hypothetical protein
MKRKRELIVTNILALVVIVSALVAGWWEAALFGLAVLLLMDLMAIFREWGARSAHQDQQNEDPSDVEDLET